MGRIGVLVLTVLALLTACVSGSEGSRRHVYASLDELVGDAKVVVVGTVEDVAPVKVADASFTEIDFKVSEQLFPRGLGAEPVDESTPTHELGPLPGEWITVRQVGPPGRGPAPSLRSGGVGWR